MDTFTEAYREAALWSSTTDNDASFADLHYDADDIDPETLRQIVEDCTAFQETYAEYIGTNRVQAGRDFWLTRNGHGAGFWDGDWDEPQASILTQGSKAYGEIDLYLGDDGRIYSS